MYEYVENNPARWIDPTGLTRLMVVRGADAENPEGLAVRLAPSKDAKLLRRIHDGTQVTTVHDSPILGNDNNWWHSLLWIENERVWPGFGMPSWYWVSSNYLVDASEPPVPPSENWRLPLDNPIIYWNGYGYYDWGQNEDGSCAGCEDYQQPELVHPDYACGLCFHNGWDMTSATSNSVYAMGDGKVIAGGGATRLHVSHTVNGVGIEIQYTHVNHPDVDVGDEVEAGQKLGNWGPYGTNFSHFHWTVKTGGKVVNPEQYWPVDVPATFTGSWGNPICVSPLCP